MIAVTTTLDEETAEMLAAVLDGQGIPIAICRLGINPYLGAATPASFEVRVPAERLADAKAALERFAAGSSASPAHDDEADAASHASAEAATDPEPLASEGATPTEERTPRLWMLTPLAIVAVLPVGCLYARWRRLGTLLLSMGLTALAVFFATRNPTALLLAGGAKALDLVLAPLLLTIENRRRGQDDSRIARGAVVSALCLVLCVGVVLLFHWEERRQRLSEQSFQIFSAAVSRINSGLPPTDEAGQIPQFPDVPIGKVHVEILRHFMTAPPRLRTILESYVSQRQQWGTFDGDTPPAAWLEARQKEAAQQCALLDQHQQAWDALSEDLQPSLEKDPTARAFFAQFATGFTSGQERERRLTGLLKELCDVWQERARQPGDSSPVAKSQALEGQIDQILDTLGAQ